MGIQPIDLQTLYTQLDKVSKNVAFQQQGVQLQNAIEQEKNAQRKNEKEKAVKETSFDDKENLKVKDQEQQKQSNEFEQKKSKSEADEKSESQLPEYEVIKDPSLGKHFDVTG